MLRCLLVLLACLVRPAHSSQSASMQKPFSALDDVLVSQPSVYAHHGQEYGQAVLSPLRALALLTMRLDPVAGFCLPAVRMRYPASKFTPMVAGFRSGLHEERHHGDHSVPIAHSIKHRIAVMSTGREPNQTTLEAKPLEAKSGLVSFSTNAAAAVCASFEVAEDIESIGHGHSMLLLTFSKFCREANVLRESVLDQAEDVEKSANKMAGKLRAVVARSSKFLLRTFSSRAATVALSMGALAAALNEVWEDSAIGGHHGALLLAVNELLEILEGSKILRGRALEWTKKRVLRLSLLLGASACALVETVGTISEFKLAAHHGVLVFALSKSLKAIGLMLKEANEAKQ